FWYRNGIFASTNATLFLNNVTTNQAGTYYVVVSNVLGTVRSSNVLVRVIPDTFGPRLLSAVVGAAEINRIFLTFDEDLLRFGPTASTNVHKYIITEISTGQRVPVTNTQVAVGNGLVRLTLSTNLDRGKTYELCLSNVTDLLTNYIALNSCVPISFEVITNSFPFGSYWWLYDWVDAPPLDWNQPEYIEDPRLWYQAPGMFYNALAGPINPPCTPQGTLLTIGPSAYYFRKHFTVPSQIIGAPATAILGRVLDDGAIFYLNGTEIMRTNMPAGPVNHGTRALLAGNPNICLTNQVAITHLLRTNNVLAVEVHQFSSPDYDAAFDSSLSISYLQTPVLTNRPPPSDVFLRYSNHSAAQLRLFWTNGMGYALEYVNALGDQWRELQPPSTNLLVNKDGPARFYRLNKRH
ncbi:MAG TPA: immunoglobulin domain-containing protein, partial [Verrucomicrobiae bacterium]|nr:immunoglobulin domain-containing protein [Verrucomicrobiae bacterium]